LTHQNYSQQNPDSGLPHECTRADHYLYECPNDLNDIDWLRLTPVAQRVIQRLLTDVNAFNAHVSRLRSDNRNYSLDPDTFMGADQELYVDGPYGPFCGCCIPILLILSDERELSIINKLIREDPPQFWKTALSQARVNFVAGDRDDLAAARLYEIAKILPVGR
jgi:hypothetical protein